MEKRERGFTLVELVVVLAIVAVLTAIALVAFGGFRDRAHDRSTQHMLTTAAKVESSLSVELDGFNVDPAQLAVIEPAIDFSGLLPESVHMVVADIVPASGDRGQMLMYARSASGTWFGIRLVSDGGLAGRHTCQDEDGSIVSDMTACVGVTW